MAGSQRDISVLSQVFRLLGDPSRLAVLAAVTDEELNVTQICRKLRMGQSTVSRHLCLLRMSSLVRFRRNGKEVYYSLPAAKRRIVQVLLARGAALAK
jgi:DNA-binding transcriptional ArsR family regulator